MNFKYRIIKLDRAAKIVEVSYEGGLTARVPLLLPFPVNRTELEKQLAVFVPKAHIQAAQSADTECLDYIEKMIGEEHIGFVSDEPPPPHVPDQIPEVVELLGVRIRAIVDQALAERESNEV